MTRFLLIRHASTDASGSVLVGRTAGVHLDQRGHAQAQALAAWLAPLPLAAVYSSPLERALQTAAPIATLRGLEVVGREDFLEIEFGAWSNRRFDELDHDAEFQRFNALRSCTVVPGGESMQQAQTRMVAGLESVRVRHPDSTVAVVSHADPIKAAVAWYAGVPLDLCQRIEISLASVSVVELGATAVRVLAVNAVADWPPDTRDDDPAEHASHSLDWRATPELLKLHVTST